LTRKRSPAEDRLSLIRLTRVELALKLEPLLRAKEKENLKTSTGGSNPQPLQKSVKAEKVNTQKDLAAIAGVSHDTIAKGKLIAQCADEETKKQLRENKISVHRVAVEIRAT
jgi:hypothetical protein